MAKKKYILIDGRRIDYLEGGKGQPIVLFPGLGVNCMVWSEVIPHLEKYFKVYAFSLPCYGTTNNLGHRYTFHTFPQLAEKLISTFKIKKPILGGHSLGAVISVEYAALHQKSVRSLLLVSAPFTDHAKPLPPLWELTVDFALKSKRTQEIADWLENNPEMIRLLCQVLFPERDRRQLTTVGKDLLKGIPAKAMASCYHDIFHWSFKSSLEKIKIPTLFIHGLKDEPINKINGTALYNLVPNAQIEALPGGHFLPSDMPKEVSEMILEFLKK
jgi:pimeloyl-ACP methyl ester carboxylesterase